jgi:IS30 family transposase
LGENTMRIPKGEVSKAERIRDLLAKGVSRDVIVMRVGCKPSEITRALDRRAVTPRQYSAKG